MTTRALDPGGEDPVARGLMATGSEVDATEEITARILQAASDLFARRGVQRPTMEEVARAAGYSRITVYRRFAAKDALIEEVIRWEFRQYFQQFTEDVKAAATVEERVVVGFVSSLKSMRANSVIGGILAADPSMAVPSVIGEHGSTLGIVSRFLAGRLRHEQEAGQVDPNLDVDLVAEMMARISASFLVTPSRVVDLDDDAQLAEIARDFLVPMLSTASSRSRS